jgi:hypothetical protein
MEPESTPDLRVTIAECERCGAQATFVSEFLAKALIAGKVFYCPHCDNTLFTCGHGV